MPTTFSSPGTPGRPAPIVSPRGCRCCRLRSHRSRCAPGKGERHFGAGQLELGRLRGWGRRAGGVLVGGSMRELLGKGVLALPDALAAAGTGR